MYSIFTVRHMKMKRISYLMIVFGLLIFVSAILNTKIDWVQLMFGSFLCVGGYFTLKEKRWPLIRDSTFKANLGLYGCWNRISFLNWTCLTISCWLFVSIYNLKVPQLSSFYVLQIGFFKLIKDSNHRPGLVPTN